MTTNLYLPRLRVRALSAAVGSGKTRAAVAWIANPSNARRNVLYVAPTQALLDQTSKDLRKAIAETAGDTVRNVHVIHSGVEDVESGTVKWEAQRVMDETEEHEGAALMVTTETFLQLVAKVQHPERWSVILDEAFKPVEFDPLSLGLDALDGWKHLMELFDIDVEQGHRLVPRAGRKGVLDDVAAGHFFTAGDRFRAYQKAARYVANPAMRCELVLTDGAKALLAGEAPTKRARSKGTTLPESTVLQFAYYVDPMAFAGFREVLFLSALFEQTILYHLWTKALGVTFEEHPDFPSHLLRDTHREQGRFLAVGHLLHKDDHASLENLQRNIHTGAPKETRPGARVVDHAILCAAANFGDEKFLLQSNERYGYRDGKACVPRNAVVIPTMAHGLNSFQSVHNVAALAVCNPTPQEVGWVKERTGMSTKAVTQAYRVHSLYQALGRCSIRRADICTDPKVVLVAGAEDARFIRDLFPGSHWMGQVGTLPSLSALQRLGKPEPGPGKVETLAKVILRNLEGIPEATRKVGSKTLKAMVETALHGQEHLRACGEDVQVEVIDGKAWQRALSLACVIGSGWQKQGQSLHRLTAEYYGFTIQA